MVRHHQVHLLNQLNLNNVKSQVLRLSKKIQVLLKHKPVFLKLPNKKGKSAWLTLDASILQCSQRNLEHCIAEITNRNIFQSHPSKQLRGKLRAEKNKLIFCGRPSLAILLHLACNHYFMYIFSFFNHCLQVNCTCT